MTSMRIRGGSVAFFLAGLVAFLPSGGQASVRSSLRVPSVFQPVKGSLQLAPHRAAEQSLNWAGYVATGKTFTGVNGSWKVPRTGTIPGFSSAWVGIGGYSGNDLIQAGTEQDTFGGYYAWYEMLPDFQIQLTGCSSDPACTVNPGNRITVTISNSGGNTWVIHLGNSGHWGWSKTVTYASSRSSAEWILEAPTLLVAQTTIAGVENTTFDPSSTYRASGSTSFVKLSSAPTLIQENLAYLEARTSDLDADRDGFTVCTYSTSCPRPTT